MVTGKIIIVSICLCILYVIAIVAAIKMLDSLIAEYDWLRKKLNCIFPTKKHLLVFMTIPPFGLIVFAVCLLFFTVYLFGGLIIAAFCSLKNLYKNSFDNFGN